MAIWQNILVELSDLERLRHICGIARLDRLEKMPECAIEGVHRCAGSGSARGSQGREASSLIRSRDSSAALILLAPNALSTRTATLSLPFLPSPQPCQYPTASPSSRPTIRGFIQALAHVSP